MSKTKTFDPDEFLFDLFAMRVSEVQEMFWGEIESETPHIEKIEVMLESGLVDMNAKDNDPPRMKRKVVRGGSWKDVGFFLQNSTRTYEYQDTTKSYVGFRCVLDLPSSNLKR